jgi:hypothetical protein
MKDVFGFLASQTGRIVRAVAGIILIALGLYLALENDNDIGWVVAVIGLVPLAAGLFDFCVLAPLFGWPFNGPDLRARARR